MLELRILRMDCRQVPPQQLHLLRADGAETLLHKVVRGFRYCHFDCVTLGFKVGGESLLGGKLLIAGLAVPLL